jgi:hypothetical protein
MLFCAGLSIIVEGEDYIEEPETFWKYGEDPDATLNPTICTRDLISWSFQIARGMEYLANRKVRYCLR